MGIFDKAKDVIGEHPDQVDKGIDKAADVADERTGGKYAADIDKGAEEIKEQVGDFGGMEQPPAAPPTS